jgi:hypothetical protein
VALEDDCKGFWYCLERFRALFIITEPVPLERCSEIGWRFLAAPVRPSERRLDQIAHRYRDKELIPRELGDGLQTTASSKALVTTSL